MVGARFSNRSYFPVPPHAGGAAHQCGTGGGAPGPKSDNDQSNIDEASQAVQDEVRGMTEDNREVAQDYGKWKP